ncbi:hypothetical protein P5673_023789 [Acropora cervicornis]|uniref:Uncharacterized protein n=1 Tax=Acropora cervicornis TaxID=6130 RepID=A0AAD9Q4W0_ACRCE|nr:hypothetical protein P5673_023789 [Acropora cervicornis]
MKKSLTACNINHRQWSNLVADRVAWRHTIHKAAAQFEVDRKIHSKIRDRGGRPALPPPPHQTFLFPAVTAHGPVSSASVWSATSAPAVDVNVDKLLKSSFAKPSHDIATLLLPFFKV